MPMGFLSWLRGHCPAGAPRWGWVAVQLGLFFLASSALLGGMLLAAGLVADTWRKGFAAYWSDGLNRLLLVVAGLLLAAATQAVSGELAWWGLFNWLPFFWGFWGWQAYLDTPEARRRCSGWLVAGTVPVVITGLGQMVLGWQGPWSMAGDLVIWHMDAGGNPSGRLSGLFDYATITAAWLALTWPLLLACVLRSPWTWRQRWPVLLLAVLHGLCLWLTASRNAWATAVLAVPLVVGPGVWAWLLPVLLLVLLPVALAVLPGVPTGLQEVARAAVPDSIWQRLSDHGFDRPVATTRLGQWSTASQLLLERPWLGWGAAAFGMLYSLHSGFSHGHPHNLPLDLGLSFGAPVALLLLAVPIWVAVAAMRHGMATASLTDRGWLAAFLLLASIHATDLPYYDARINMAGWFLLAGLRAYGLAAAQRRLTGAMSGGAQMECRLSNSN
ncbi:MAG: ligase [Candidatus Synechococcus spongiarum 142]|uniref:Ligase n=1 Tax=Candidatus Synechococcus spongiarum 142 TaxID=1608213 RepID=A0A6N3X795_9SYNE|nr:MAG: ligase [Candidatus Synechococcus spongiarum 142]